MIMNFFPNNMTFKTLYLIIVPFILVSQDFVDDIYYSDNEVNYDFLDIEIPEKNMIENIDNSESSDYYYDEEFSYSDKIDRFENNYFDYYWDYNFYYSPWENHYYNYHGIHGFGWPNLYNGWGFSSYYGWGYPNYYGWGYPNYYGWGYPNYYGWGYPNYYGWGYTNYYGWGYNSYAHHHLHYFNNNYVIDDNTNIYYGHRDATNTNQSTISNIENRNQNKIISNNIISGKHQNIKLKSNNKNNQSIEKLTFRNKSNNKKRNNVFKEIVNDLIQKNSNVNYKNSNREKYNNSNKNNYNNSKRINYSNSNRNSFNNSSKSRSNSSRGGRKP